MRGVGPLALMSSALPRSALRLALIGISLVGATVALILFAYELALARIPQHRAALERIVRSQTGLDIRFTELELRWGWYGPEAVFRQVELDEPGSVEALLRAPELVVGFDAWRTLRSGHPEAGRIELVAPEIDLSGARGTRAAGRRALDDASQLGVAQAGESSVLGRVAVLQGWRGGRIDIEGGTLHLPDHGGNANLLNVQIRRASLRRSDNEWSVAGLVYLPDRVGRSARITLRVNGDLSEPARLAGTLHIEARRLLFPGCREFFATVPLIARYLPRGGSGDLNMEVSFAQGQVVKANGTAHGGGLVFDPWPDARNPLAVALLQGDWRISRVAGGWRAHFKSLQLGGLELAGMQLQGLAHNADFDWLPGRPEGDRLQAQAKFEDVALVPRSQDFTLSGLSAGLSGNESELTVVLRSRGARLELAQSQQQPLADVHVSSTVHISNGDDGWQLATDEFLLEHQRASLRLNGVVQDDSAEPRINANGTLSGADISLVARILDTDEAFGPIASRLTAGRIQNAEFALRGPLGKLPFGEGGEGFTGSLQLRDAVLSNDGIWPDANGVDARVEWRGTRIQATIESAHAGPFQLASAKAQWDADGGGPTRLSGHLTGRLEEAIAWVRDHPQLQEYAPAMQEIDARGEATFDFNVAIPSGVDSDSRQSQVVARVATFVDGASLQAIPGLPPLEGITGSFTFDSGRLQRSILTGKWLGGPVTLTLGEGREKTLRTMRVQAQGTLNAGQLATAANAIGTVEGSTDWMGELVFVPGEAGHWRMRVDSNLSGLVSSLPEPFAKRPVALLPAHLEVAGSGEAAQLRASLGDRMRSLVALQRKPGVGWVVERGAVRLGIGAPALPSEDVVLVRGHLGRLDLPAYAVAWERLRHDSLPMIRAQLVTDEMLIAGHPCGAASLRAERTDSGTDLLIDSAQLAGIARWPASHPVSGGRGSGTETQPVELRLTRLQLPDEALPGEAIGLVAALAPSAVVSVDELNWRGRSLGRLTANASVEDHVVVLDGLRLVNGTQQAQGALRCQPALPLCRLTFTMDSSDAGATLTDFGFRADVAAGEASLRGDLEWQPAPENHWLDSLHGTMSMRLADGMLRAGERDEGEAEGKPGGALSGSPGHVRAGAFGLLSVPALVAGLDAREQRDLHFARLDADFEVQNGQASTSNLHFDGDAEILMRGRTGLASRDYDQQVWVLRGEERLPAAVRRFGASPRVAAAWLSLRELFAGSGSEERSRAVLRLQGSWDDPMVVAEN